MKSVTFFLVVFLTMLTAFLFATGEVGRWFSGDAKERSRVFDAGPEVDDATENTLYFPFYDVDRGALSFTIRAELSQNDLAVKDKLDEARHLVLRNGTLEIPIEGGVQLNAADGENESPRSPDEEKQIVLRFETAEWNQAGAKADAKPGESTQVVLTNGRGQTVDGFEFFFEKLLFEYLEGDAEKSYRVSSLRPVSIKNDALELASPSGLIGTLRPNGKGLDTLSLLPPIRANIDPERAPFFKGAIGAAVAQPAKSGEKPSPDAKSRSTDSEKPKKTERRVARADRRRIGIESDGRLEFRAVEPAVEGGPRRTLISFKDNVVIRPVPVTKADGGSTAVRSAEDDTRFECRQLDLSFAESDGGLVPESAVATWPGDRVKAYFQRAGKSGIDSYVVSGERLEWNYEPPSEVGDDGQEPAQPAVSEAVLSGSPTLVGDGASFSAQRAVLGLTEGRVLLERVTGEFENELHKEARQPGERDEGDVSKDPVKASRLPRHWRLRADEVEFYFARSAASGRQEFTHFEARSDHGGEVEVHSFDKADGAVTETPTVPVRLRSSRVSFLDAERTFVFVGRRGERPRLDHGENWIEAEGVRLQVTDGKESAVFEKSVVAHIVDTGHSSECLARRRKRSRTLSSMRIAPQRRRAALSAGRRA